MYIQAWLRSHTLEVDANWINKFLGTDISKREMKSILID